MRNLLAKQQGFTIVELLVVIVVIAILATLTIPQLFGVLERGRDTDRKNDLKNLQAHLEEFYMDNEFYPVALNELETDYLEEVPTDPRTGDDYVYAAEPTGCDNTATNCTTYTVTASLENENDRDADEDGNYVIQSVNR